ncbi:MAG: hypothetical protein ABIR18_00020 [Chitinophagaceae bacterium]
MKKLRNILAFNAIKISLLLLLAGVIVSPSTVTAQNKNNKGPATYRNLFREAGYSQADINKKVEKAYYDVFEGPGRVYFEVGDSMGYVSDLKNHDARTEGLS